MTQSTNTQRIFSDACMCEPSDTVEVYAEAGERLEIWTSFDGNPAREVVLTPEASMRLRDSINEWYASINGS